MPSADEGTTAPKATPTPKQKAQGGPKRATLDQLLAKKRVQKELAVMLNGEEVTFLFRAISAREYDRLLTQCPPNTEQRANSNIYNINTFAPMLLARVIIEPEITEDQWIEFWTSPDWNRGELMGFFGEAVDVCSTGLDLGPTATG